MAIIGYLDAGTRATPDDDYVYSLFLFDSVSGAQTAQIALQSQAYNFGNGTLSRDGLTLAVKGVNDSFIYFCDTASGNIRTTPITGFISAGQYGFGPEGNFYAYVFGTPGVLISIPPPYTTPSYISLSSDPITDFSVTGVADLIVISTRDQNSGSPTGIFRLNASTGAQSTYIDLGQTAWSYGSYAGVIASPDARFMALSPANLRQNITTFDVDATLLTSSDSSGNNTDKSKNAGFSGDGEQLVYRYGDTTLAVRNLTSNVLNIRDFQVQLDDNVTGSFAADYTLVGMVDDSHVLLHNRGLLAVLDFNSGVVTTRINKRNQGLYETDGLPIAYRGLGIGGPPPEPAGFWQDFVKATEAA
jgi:hypothetical protein